jgi:two-component system NtrC family sensor kinase
VLFTRTIRRKLLVGAGLVMGMLLILSASGISGLNSYRSVIRQLDFDLTEAPQQAELLASAVALFEPLGERDQDGWWHVDDNPRAVLRLGDKLEALLDSAQDRLDEFRRRSDKLPSTRVVSGKRLATEPLLQAYDDDLKRLGRLNRQLVDEGGDARSRSETLRQMEDQIAGLLTVASRIPDPVAGMSRSLEQAKGIYRSSLVVMWVTSTVVLVLFLGLLRSGYLWIFDPIRKLHQGARRVAQGDFNYRVDLKTRDEMAELADAFNKMTGRFQEIAADLDRQVQERSRQLVRSERLAGVGFLAAGVAHEINNPLSAIAMAGESLAGRLMDNLDGFTPAEADVIRQYLTLIQDESFRCKQITERLLDFARGREAVREPTDVARLVSEVVAMVQYLTKYREKKIDFSSPGSCYASVNAAEIKQVVLNLVANGLDAVERGGSLRVSLLERTDHLVIEFKDDGCGMTPETIENLFEPFFTRKQAGQGTGLGLSISHRIISQHGGTIAASSPGAGLGSTFAVRLPREPAAQAAAA